MQPTVCIHFVLFSNPVVYSGPKTAFNVTWIKCLNHLAIAPIILRVEKHWEYWLNYSNDLLVKSIEKFDILSYKAFLNTAFNKLVYTYVIVYVFVKQSRILHLFDLILGRIWCYSITVLICWE